MAAPHSHPNEALRPRTTPGNSVNDFAHEVVAQWGEVPFEQYATIQTRIFDQFCTQKGWQHASTLQKDEIQQSPDALEWLVAHVDDLRALVHHGYGSAAKGDLRAQIERFCEGGMPVEEFETLLGEQRAQLRTTH